MPINTLDLHGKRHADAKLLVEEFILSHESPVTIITGNSFLMKKLVTAVLNANNMHGIEIGPKIIVGNK